MSAVTVHPRYADPAPISRALKGLAKLHELPPFQRLYGSGRTSLIVVAPEHAEQWRAALGSREFFTEDEITWRSSVFWLGVRVELVYVTEGEN